MFGPSKEVKALIEKLKTDVKANWDKYNADPNAFTNADFVKNIVNWRDRNHPKTLTGKYKKLDDWLVFSEQMIVDYDYKKLATQMHEPSDANLGDCFNEISFDNELILAIYNNSNTGFVITNERFLLFVKGGNWGNNTKNHNSYDFSEISDISLGKGLSQGKFSINGDHIGNFYLDESAKFVRSLLEQFARECQSFSKSNGSENTSSGSGESGLDKLKKLKELLEMDVITQEEFDAKKDEIMKDI